MINFNRRKLIGGIGLLIAAPAVIRVAQLMPIKAKPETKFWLVNRKIDDDTVIWIGSDGKIYQCVITPGKIEWTKINDPLIWITA